MVICCMGNCETEEEEERNQREALEQRAARALTAHEALAARRAVELQLKQAAGPPVHAQLPYFPYAEAQGWESEMLCAICLDPLRQGQLCSELPACRHAFHRDCLGAWVKSKGSCPLCRETIVVLGSDDVAVAHDMV
ncbi:hypothetical protein QOZ80_6BG0467830 [Eleusine coracana subsp. coracana]|nr:hypothetical protein QOZ80_6BG0467830 [Eleusine coracana subsp. coracana]